MSFPPYERDKDFKKPLSIRPNGHQIKVCSQCEEEFPNGYDYRMHWEQVHFYPFLKKNKFDHVSALKKQK